MKWLEKAKKENPHEPEWSLKAKEMHFRYKYALNLINRPPEDPDVEQAYRDKDDFLSPLGLHWWDGKGNYWITGCAISDEETTILDVMHEVGDYE